MIVFVVGNIIPAIFFQDGMVTGTVDASIPIGGQDGVVLPGDKRAIWGIGMGIVHPVGFIVAGAPGIHEDIFFALLKHIGGLKGPGGLFQGDVPCVFD